MSFATAAMIEEARQFISTGRVEVENRDRIEICGFLRIENINAIVEKLRLAYVRVYLDEVTTVYFRKKFGQLEQAFSLTVTSESITEAVARNSRCQDALLKALTTAEPSVRGLSFNVDKTAVCVSFKPVSLPSIE